MKTFQKPLVLCLLALAMSAFGEPTVSDHAEAIKISTDDGVFYLRKSAIIKINAVRGAVVIEYQRQAAAGEPGGNTLPIPFETFDKAKAFAKEVADLTFGKPFDQKPAPPKPAAR
jgi:hypothetical protein